jgi:hypothetical protein
VEEEVPLLAAVGLALLLGAGGVLIGGSVVGTTLLLVAARTAVRAAEAAD